MASRKTIWDLALEITGEDKGAKAALNQVKRNIKDVQNAGKQLGADFKKFTQNATKLALGVAGGVTAAGAGVMSMANSFADAGNKVLKAARTTGIGVEAYQELQYALGKSGVSAETFDSALEKFNLTVRQGAAGNATMAKKLAELGMCAKDFANMAPETALMKISEYMKQLPNDAERTRVAVELFGKSAGPEMMAALKQGSEAIADLREESKKMTFSFSQNQAEIAEQFKNTKKGLAGAFDNVKFSFIAGSMGPVTEALETLQKTITDSVPSIAELGEKFGRWLGDMVERLPEIIEKIKEFGSWIKETITNTKDLVGGWENLAKIVAGLVIAPTFISGLKTVWSLGKFIKAVAVAIPGILVGIKGGLAFIASAALPITAIIAGIALAVYTVIRNIDALKAYVKECSERIKTAFGIGNDGAKKFAEVMNVAKKVLGGVLGILEGAMLFAIKTVLNALTSCIQIGIGAFKVLWGVVKLIFWPLLTVIKLIIGLFKGGLSGAAEAWGGQIGKLGEIFKGIFGGLKTFIGGFIDFFINGFKDGIDAIDGIIGGIADKFGFTFSSIKDFMVGAFTGAIDWIKTNWKAIVLFIINPFVGVFKYLYDNFDGFRNFVDNVVIAVKGFFQAGIDLIKGKIAGIPESFQRIYNGIKNIVGNVAGFFKNAFGSAVTAVKNIIAVLPNLFSDPIGTIKTIVGEIAGFFKNVFAGAIDAVKGIISNLPAPFRNAFGLIGGIAGGLVGFLKNVFASGVEAVRNIVAVLPNFFSDPIGTIKAIVGEIGGFFRNVFVGAVDAVKGIVGGLANAFGGAFDSIKEKILGFVNFFQEKTEAIRNFFGGIGGMAGGIAGGALGKFKPILPGHAEGGIFAYRHIAEIAERGAEAVVPLDKSPRGFDVWKQAGMIGGYMSRMARQPQGGTESAGRPEAPPVLREAARRVSSGGGSVHVAFTQNNTFNGTAPDAETVHQISAAGQQAADDFEARVKSAMESIMRNQRRVAFA